MTSETNLQLTRQWLSALFHHANLGSDVDLRVEKVINLLQDDSVGELDKPESVRNCLACLLKSPIDGSDLATPTALDSATLSLLHRYKADTTPSFALLPSNSTLPSPSLFARTIPRSSSQTYIPSLNHKSSSSSLRSVSSNPGTGGSALKNTIFPPAPGTPTSPFAPVSPSPLARRIVHDTEEDEPSAPTDEVRSRTSTDSRNSGGDGSSSGGLNAFATEFKPRLAGLTGNGSSTSLNVLPRGGSFEDIPNQNLPSSTSSSLLGSSALSSRSTPPPGLTAASGSRLKHIDLPPRGFTPTDPASLWNSSPLGTPTKFPTLIHTPPIPSPAGSDIPRNPWNDEIGGVPGITGLASGISNINLGGGSNVGSSSLGKNATFQDENIGYDPWADTPAANPNIHVIGSGGGSGASTPSRRLNSEDIWGVGAGGLTSGLSFEVPGHSPVSELHDPLASLVLNQAAGSANLPTGLNGYQSSYEMTPLDFLYTLFSSPEGGGFDLEPEELEEALNRNNYDINKTVEFILESRFATSSANTGNIIGLTEGLGGGMEIKPGLGVGGVGSNRNSLLMGSGSRPLVVSRDSFDRQFRPGGGGSNPGSRPHTPTGGGRFGLGGGGRPVTPTSVGGKVCRYYLQGACLRSDCRYSHDVGKAVCKFWLRGNCLKGPERCGFLHSIPPVMRPDSLERQLPGEINIDPTGDVDPDFTDYIDFPTLDNISPRLTHAIGADLNRQRFSQAVKYGRGNLSLHASRKDVRTPPVQPRPSPRVNLRPPQLLPTVKTGVELQNLYAQYRENSVRATVRNELLTKAGEAWHKADGASARKFAREADEMNRSISLAGRLAAARILDERRRCLKEAVAAQVWKSSHVDEKPDRAQRARDVGGGLGVILGVVAQRPDGPQLTADERTEAAIDLHGLNADEALEFLDRFLSALESEQFMGQTYLIVGSEKHIGQGDSQRGPVRQKLAQTVMEYLSGNLYPWRDLKTGIIVVDAAR